MKKMFIVLAMVAGLFVFVGCSSLNTTTESVVVLKNCSKPTMTVLLGEFSANEGQNKLVYTSDELKKAITGELSSSKCIVLAQSSEREKIVGRLFVLNAQISSNVDSLITDGLIKDKKREHYVAKIATRLLEKETGNMTYSINSSGRYENSTTSYLGLGDSDKTDTARVQAIQKAAKAIVKEIESIE